MGIRRIVATGEHGESEATLRRVRHTHITRENLRRAIIRVVNATFEHRDPAWWGTGTACASDSQALRVLAIEPDDRVARPLRRPGRDDLLARRAQEHLHLQPAALLLGLGGRRDD